MRPQRLYQATDKTFSVEHDFGSDMTLATEVTVYIDTPSQIVKTLGDGVSGVGASTFLLTIALEDTDNVPEGEYPIDGYITTASGDRKHMRLQPHLVKILPSNWATARELKGY